MTAILAVFTIVLSACAGALASYMQIRATRRDEIFLQKIELAYAAGQDYITNLNAAFLNMETTLHGKHSLADYYDLASKPRDNVRAYRDIEMYLTLYFPNILPALSEMYDVRGRLVKAFFDGEKSLKIKLSVDASIKSRFRNDLGSFDLSAKKLLSEIATEARTRFAHKSKLRNRLRKLHLIFHRSSN